MPKGSEYRARQAEDLSKRMAAARAKDAAVAAAQEKARKDGQGGGRHRA
jgi:hypothetical protein